MKLIDTRDGRTLEGELVVTIPANEPVPEPIMKRYYKLKTGDRNYEILAKPMPLERVVLQRGEPADDNYYIVPRYDFYREEE